MTAETNPVEIQICRGCLNECKEYKSLFKVGLVTGEMTTLAAMLTDLTTLEFVDGDEMPKSLCTKCIRDLCKSYIFKQTVMKSQQTLMEQQEAAKSEEEMYETFYFIDENSDEDEYEMIDFQESNAIVASEFEIQSDNDNCEMQEVHLSTVASGSLDGEIDFKVETEDEAEQLANQSSSVIAAEQKKKEEIILPKGKNDEKADENNRNEMNETNQSTVNRQMKDDLIDKHLKTTQVPARKRRTKPLNGQPFKCEVCGKQLSNYSSHKYHMQLHSDVTPFLCSECGEKFKTRNAYEGHMTTHNSKNPNICNVCGKTYRQASSLRSHILTHTGEKPYLCGICGKGMTQKSGFKKHMLIHTGEKPFECEICQKKFRYSSNLNAHTRQHVFEKFFFCYSCEKQFSTKEQLKRHTQTHNRERPFSCNLCDRAFARRSTLTVHRQMHIIEEPKTENSTSPEEESSNENIETLDCNEEEVELSSS